MIFASCASILLPAHLLHNLQLTLATPACSSSIFMVRGKFIALNVETRKNEFKYE